MGAKIKVFMDTSALFAAVHLATGGARLILKLGEAGALDIWIGPNVLEELDGVIDRKAPQSKPYIALLLQQAQIEVGDTPPEAALHQASQVISYLPDAQIVAEAIASEVDYFVSFDRKHLVGNPQADELPFAMGTAGDFLAWYRVRLSRAEPRDDE